MESWALDRQGGMCSGLAYLWSFNERAKYKGKDLGYDLALQKLKLLHLMDKLTRREVAITQVEQLKKGSGVEKFNTMMNQWVQYRNADSHNSRAALEALEVTQFELDIIDKNTDVVPGKKLLHTFLRELSVAHKAAGKTEYEVKLLNTEFELLSNSIQELQDNITLEAKNTLNITNHYWNG